MTESHRDIFRRTLLRGTSAQIHESGAAPQSSPQPERAVVLAESSRDVLRRTFSEDGGGEPPKAHKLSQTNGKSLLAYYLGGTFDKLKVPPTEVLKMIGGGDLEKGKKLFIGNIDKISKLSKGSGKPARKDMPVIHPKDIAAFVMRLSRGEIDIVKPHASVEATQFDPKAIDAAGGKGQPKPLKDFFKRGKLDGVKKDDIVKGIKEVDMPVGRLKPSQDEIYGSKVCFNMSNFGPTVGGTTAFGKADIIVTSDNFILDGHHRWATAFAGGSTNKIKVTVVPLPFKHLYLIMRAYGAATGNRQQA